MDARMQEKAGPPRVISQRSAASMPEVWIRDKRMSNRMGISKRKWKYDISSYFKKSPARVIEISKDKNSVVKIVAQGDDPESDQIMLLPGCDVEVQVGDVGVTASGEIKNAWTGLNIEVNEEEEETGFLASVQSQTKKGGSKTMYKFDMTSYFGRPRLIIITKEPLRTKIAAYGSMPNEDTNVLITQRMKRDTASMEVCMNKSVSTVSDFAANAREKKPVDIIVNREVPLTLVDKSPAIVKSLLRVEKKVENLIPIARNVEEFESAIPTKIVQSVEKVKSPIPSDESVEVKSIIPTGENVEVKSSIPADKIVEVESFIPADRIAEVESSIPVDKKAEVECSIPVDKKAEVECSIPVDKKAEVECSIPVDKKAEVESSILVDKKAEVESNIPADENVELESITTVENIEMKSSIPADENVELESIITVENVEVKSYIPVDENVEVSNIPADKVAEVESSIPVVENVEVESSIPVVENVEVESSIPVVENVEVESSLPADKIVEVKSFIPADKIVEVESFIPADKIVEVESFIPADRIVEVESSIPADKIKIVEVESFIPADRMVEVESFIPADRIVEVESNIPADKIVEVESSLPVDKNVGVESSTPADRIAEVESSIPVGENVEVESPSPTVKNVKKKNDDLVESSVSINVDKEDETDHSPHGQKSLNVEVGAIQKAEVSTRLDSDWYSFYR